MPAELAQRPTSYSGLLWDITVAELAQKFRWGRTYKPADRLAPNEFVQEVHDRSNNVSLTDAAATTVVVLGF
jgi:hypothetical protein